MTDRPSTAPTPDPSNPLDPPTTPNQVSVCFQFITDTGAVIDSEAETYPSLQVATQTAKDWADMKGQSLSFITYEGDGAVVKVDRLDHIAVMTAAKMASLYVDLPPVDSPTEEGSTDGSDE